MKTLMLLIMGMFQVFHVLANPYKDHFMEKIHMKTRFTTTMNPVVDKATDTKRPDTRWTPDFRLPQPMLEPWEDDYIETHRPYRVSPHYHNTYYFPNREKAYYYGCYCTTVYKRIRLLAGCAVLTPRHILTTATSTELVLRKFRKSPDLQDILGFWYDVNNRYYNSSMYGEPARIHYHPLYTFPKDVNRTHPFPIMFDLAVWTTTHNLYGSFITCSRAGPHKWDAASSTPTYPSVYNIFGFQFMRAYSREPQPWYKYTVRIPIYEANIPCPKSEWGWYHCFDIGSWAPLGLDNGAPLHRMTIGMRRYYGLTGMNVLSMKLRSKQIVSYFIDINNHNVLEFLYDAYMGKLPYIYLDARYENTYGGSPQIKSGHNVRYIAQTPAQNYDKVTCCLHEDYRPGYKN